METMTLFDDAFTLVQTQLRRWPSERILVRQAMGRILARDADAVIDVPPFARAMMDGYALCAADVQNSAVELTVRSTIAAGSPPTGCVAPGHAIRVMTGAPVPVGTAAVVRQEWCTKTVSGIRILRHPSLGESVQSVAADGSAAQPLIAHGRELTELDAAVLQTFGVHSVVVVRKPQASIIVTGSELVETTSVPLCPGQIYGTNDLLLHGALQSDGVDVRRVVYVHDDLAALTKLIREAATDSDLVFVTGGVSVGDYDFTPTALTAVAGRLQIRKVWMRPGSPFAFTTHDNVALFGLSGNPAACFVQYATIVRPAIRCALGLTDQPFPARAILSHDIRLKSIKHTIIHRASLHNRDGQLLLNCNIAQSTGVISSFLDTDVYVRFDEDTYQTGDIMPIRWLRGPSATRC